MASRYGKKLDSGWKNIRSREGFPGSRECYFFKPWMKETMYNKTLHTAYFHRFVESWMLKFYDKLFVCSMGSRINDLLFYCQFFLRQHKKHTFSGNNQICWLLKMHSLSNVKIALWIMCYVGIMCYVLIVGWKWSVW